LERIPGCILLMPELYCWVGLDLRLVTCATNRKVPHQKPGVTVGHLHSTAKRLVSRGFPSRETSKAGSRHGRLV